MQTHAASCWAVGRRAFTREPCGGGEGVHPLNRAVRPHAFILTRLALADAPPRSSHRSFLSSAGDESASADYLDLPASSTQPVEAASEATVPEAQPAASTV